MSDKDYSFNSIGDGIKLVTAGGTAETLVGVISVLLRGQNIAPKNYSLA